jgi:glycosyltransferase involved in cell wall biosynthesis
MSLVMDEHSFKPLMDKITILTSAHPVFDVRIYHKQAKALFAAGYNVTLIAQHERDETVDGIRIIGLPKARNKAQRMIGLTFRLLRLALKERGDVYHFHDPDLISVGLLLKLFGAKVIYDVHEDYPASIRQKPWLPFFMRPLLSKVFDVFERTSSYFFDAIVPATDHISTRFNHKNVVIIHNYPILHPTADTENTDLAGQDNTIIYAGGLVEIRGIRELVQSLEYIDEKWRVNLKLLGKFPNGHFEKSIKSMPMYSKVNFLGFVPLEEVNHHLSTARIGLVLFHPAPNHLKAMPNKMFEYMSATLPVIASNFPLWKEIVEGNNCGLTVDPMNPREIASAVEYLLGRAELIEELGKNGRKAVLERYNWQQESKNLLKLYEEFVTN